MPSASTVASCALSRRSSDVINYVLGALRNVAMAQIRGRGENVEQNLVNRHTSRLSSLPAARCPFQSSSIGAFFLTKK